MKNLKRRVVGLFLTVAMLLGMMGAVPVEAAKESSKVPTIYESVRIQYIYKTEKSSFYSSNIEVQNVTKTSQITKLKSSNPKVADTKVEMYNGKVYILAIAKKTGTAKISFTAKYDNGKKSKNLSFIVKFKKYVNPCASLKIGSKEYKNEFKDAPTGTKIAPGKKKISVKAAKGWEVRGIYYSDNWGSGAPKSIKNNSVVTMKNGGNLDIQFSPKGTQNDYNSLSIDVSE